MVVPFFILLDDKRYCTWQIFSVFVYANFAYILNFNGTCEVNANSIKGLVTEVLITEWKS